MSTKIPINFSLEAQSEIGVEERHNLSDIINELNQKQRQLLQNLYLKQALEDKKILLDTKGGVKAKICDAVTNLTQFCDNDDEEKRLIEQQLQNTIDVSKHRIGIVQKQDGEVRN